MRKKNLIKLSASFALPILFLVLMTNSQSQAAESLWATNYYVHAAAEKSDGAYLKTMADKNLIRVSRKDWCLGAIEGTIVVSSGTTTHTYNYAGTKSRQLDCKPFLSPQSRNKPWAGGLGKTRWAEVDAPFGLGTGGYKLVPFKTIAVDKNKFPIGTVLFINAAKGAKYNLPNGQDAVHDGYFLAADVGSAIKDNHIDVFTGVGPNTVFNFIESTSSGTFSAEVVNDAAIIKRLKDLHK